MKIKNIGFVALILLSSMSVALPAKADFFGDIDKDVQFNKKMNEIVNSGALTDNTGLWSKNWPKTAKDICQNIQSVGSGRTYSIVYAKEMYRKYPSDGPMINSALVNSVSTYCPQYSSDLIDAYIAKDMAMSPSPVYQPSQQSPFTAVDPKICLAKLRSGSSFQFTSNGTPFTLFVDNNNGTGFNGGLDGFNTQSQVVGTTDAQFVIFDWMGAQVIERYTGSCLQGQYGTQLRGSSKNYLDGSTGEFVMQLP
jgi:hypothetical protein